MIEYLKRFEKIIIILLAVMMSLVILLSTIELGWIILKDITTPPVFLPDINELLDIFGLFLLVLIGIELLLTIKTYAIEKVVHAEVGANCFHDRYRAQGYNPGYKRNSRSYIVACISTLTSGNRIPRFTKTSLIKCSLAPL